MWMLLVLLYGLLKGGREIAKKKAMAKNSVMEVLVIYTLISFLLVIPQAPKAGGVEPKFFFFIVIKAFCIFVAWICSFHSLKKLPVSLYGILDLSRVLFATSFGVFLLGEVLHINQVIGLITVCAGLLLLKFKPAFLKKLFKMEDQEEIKTAPVQNQPAEINARPTYVYVILAFVSCFLNAISGLLDKLLMQDLTSSQLQFWYMLFLIGFYFLYILITREKIRASVFKNIWVWLMAIMFVIADKALFVANGMPGSRITVMTLIKQSGCLVTILGGKFIFKEKNIAYKLFCAIVVILGILFGVM